MLRLKKLLGLSAAVLAIQGALVGVASAGGVVAFDGHSAESISGYQNVRWAPYIEDCLRDPNYPADAEVSALENAPGGRVKLLCGNEIYGARHINAGHPIASAPQFEECWLATVAAGRTRPGSDPNGSTEFYIPYAPGREAVVSISNDVRDILTAYTTGPNSADWAGCAALRRR